MAQIRKLERNKDIYDLFKKLKWSKRKIAREKGLSHVRVIEIIKEIEANPELVRLSTGKI